MCALEANFCAYSKLRVGLDTIITITTSTSA